MGNFNPSKPTILGPELVGIADLVRDADIFTEVGYGFTVTGAPRNTIEAARSSPTMPSSAIAGQTLFYSIYPRGREDDTGEIRVTRLPVSAIFVTGVVVSGGSGALNDASDNGFLLFDALADRARLNFSLFSVDPTRRVLGVDLVYQVAGNPGFAMEASIESNTVRYPYGPLITGPPQLTQVADLGVLRLGEVNPWWSTVTGPDTNANRMPWQGTAMTRWSTTPTGGQLYIGIRPTTIPLSGSVKLGYAAIDVYHCEESRVAYGGLAYGQDPNGLLAFTAVTTASVTNAEIRDPSALALDVLLAPGDYTVTATLADAGDFYNAGDKLGLHQIYEYRGGVRSHPAIQVEKFKRPSSTRPVIAPVASPINFMTPILMISDGDPLQTGEASVPYANIAGAPVYLTPAGVSIFARQPVRNSASASDTGYEQIRFYARRFNPLALGDLTVTVSGSGSATITPAQFAALDELTLGIDGVGTGWKEITLPIAATFTSDGSFRNVTYTMTGVSASSPIDQWQILTLTSTLEYTSNDRYDGGLAGTLNPANPTWKNSDTVFTPVTSAFSTIVTMLSTDAPAPTGLAISALSQAVSGIGQGCYGVPACIPTGINYNSVTWSRSILCGSSSPVVTGGYLELQRMDTVDNLWQTIALTSICVTGVSDYEARVNVLSSYRIRACNASAFCGPWSTQADFFAASPGVSGVGTGNSTLIFTSNIGPTGNLAYTMVWDGDIEEDFTFPEAGQIQYRTQYQRDFTSAFHGTERGGEAFSRQILVQAAAIALESLANFKSLRDLAWADLPYICVRDELGNRWFASVQVPNGIVKRNRRLYYANINIIESTSTPAPIVI